MSTVSVELVVDKRVFKWIYLTECFYIFDSTLIEQLDDWSHGNSFLEETDMKNIHNEIMALIVTYCNVVVMI